MACAQCYAPLIARLVAAAPPANATAAQIPTAPINPCSSSWNSAPSSADGSAEGSAEGDVDPSGADTSPGAGGHSRMTLPEWKVSEVLHCIHEKRLTAFFMDTARAQPFCRHPGEF